MTYNHSIHANDRGMNDFFCSIRYTSYPESITFDILDNSHIPNESVYRFSPFEIPLAGGNTIQKEAFTRIAQQIIFWL